MVLDPTGYERLHRLQDTLGDTYFQDVPPQQGKDDESRVSLTLDAAVRFTQVHINDFRAIGGSTDALNEAFQQAYAAADGLRAQVSAESSPRKDEIVARAEAIRNGTFKWPDPREGRSTDITSRAGGRARDPIAKTGTSGNGYLTVTLPGGRFGEMQVQADEVWLRSVDAQKVERAVQEAITDAGEWAE